MLCAGLALVAAVGWMAHRAGGERDASVTPAAPKVAAAVPPAQPAPVDLHAELERRVIDRAAFAPLWTRESLIDQVAPFSPSSPEAAPSSAPLPVEAADATGDGAREVSVRLAKGETVGSALQKLGLGSDAVAAVVSALAAHVSLKSLPAGLGMTAQLRPADNGGTQPILETLTVHPTGRRQAITIERDAKGKYAVEQRKRSSAR